MKRIDKITRFATAAIAACMTLGLYIYAVFYYRFSFNYETDINGQYLFALIAVAGLTIIWGLNIFQRECYRHQHAALIAATVLLAIPVFSDKYSFANEYWTQLLSCFVLFACLAFLPIRLAVKLPYFLVAMVLVQLGLAFAQVGKWGFDGSSINLQGSLQNSGIFACYLAIHIPLIYYVVFQHPTSGDGFLHKQAIRIKAFCFLTFMLVIALVIYCAQSRSAMTGVVAAITSLCLYNFPKHVETRWRRIPTWVITASTSTLIIIITFAAWQLFLLKKDSAMGRVMKWEIAGRHIADHFFTGTGIGRFGWYYPQWQASYFANNPEPPSAYSLNAGESYIIFNEYLQLFETVGLIGFAGFIVTLTWFFRSRSDQYPQLLSTIKATMVTLLSTGLSTYTLHVNAFLIAFVLCFSIAIAVSSKSIPLRSRSILSMLLFIVSGYTTFKVYQEWKATEIWKNAKEDPAIVASPVWPDLTNSLSRDGKFLTEYGHWQLSNGQSTAAIATLEKARQHFISRYTLETLADAYEEAGNYKAAIETRRWLCHYLPGKFAPRHALLTLYVKMGDTTNAMQLANEILTMPVKIPSIEIDNIRNDAKKMITSH